MTTYYVAQSSAGGDTGADCANTKSLTWFNANGVAGDTAILCDGSYSTLIAPTNSGTPGNPITYIADNQYAAVLSTSSHGTDLTNNDYIIINGIYYNNCGYRWILFDNSDYNIIQNCKFYDSASYSGIRLTGGSDTNIITNCIFEDAPVLSACTGCESLPYDSGCDCDTAPANFIQTYNTTRLLVKNCAFGNCSHNAIDGTGNNDLYCVYRNNDVHNTWRSGFSMAYQSHHFLIENNIFHGMGSVPEENPLHYSRTHSNWIDDNIVGARAVTCGGYADYINIRNNIYYNNGRGVYLYGLIHVNCGSEHSRVHNNTFYNNVSTFVVLTDNYNDSPIRDLVVKNNISNSPSLREITGHRVSDDEVNFISNMWTPSGLFRWAGSGNASTLPNASLAETKTLHSTSWHSSNVEGEPTFMDASNNDFTLQTTSPCLNAGAHLTTITSATNTGQTTIVVNDAGYFYDGWSIPNEVGDTVMTEAGEETTIQSINYTTHTLTISPAIDIVNGEGISLTYTGSAPNIGAYQGVGEAGSGVHYPYTRTRGVFRSPLLYNAIGGRFK